MASPNPVPSRAVLNALRGVLFTTSCSVVLLAEERRHRIKTARSAIDNARLLHTVRSRRRSAGLAEAMGACEARLAELNDDDAGLLASTPRTKGVRRRRRDSALYIGQLFTEDGLEDLADTLTTSSSPREPPSSERPPPAAAPAASRKSSLANLSSQSLSRPTMASHAASRNITRPRNPPRHVDGNRVQSAEATTTETRERPSNRTTASSLLPSGVTSAQDHGAVLLHASQCLKASIAFDTNSPPNHADALAALEAIRADLDTTRLEPGQIAESLDMAIKLFDTLATLYPLVPVSSKTIKSTGLRLLKHAVSMGPTNVKIVPLLHSLLPVCTDSTHLLLSFVDWLRKHKYHDAIQRTLQYLYQQNQSAGWDRGLLAYGALRRCETARNSFEEAKHMYGCLTNAGLFETIRVQPEMEFKIRRIMAVLALSAGDDALAQMEMKRLSELDSRATEEDVRIKGARILRDARLGLWSAVDRDLCLLSSSPDVKLGEFQSILTGVTDSFAQKQPVRELETFVRQLVDDHKMPLQDRWVYRILGLHGSRQDLQSTLSWLEFCKNNGTMVSDTSFQSFWSTSLKYWGYSGVVVKWLQKVRTDSSEAAERTSGAEEGTKAPSEGDVFGRMTRLTREGDWHRVCDVYDNAALKPGSSPRCFRLHISARIKQDHGNCEQAIKLVHEAHEQGHDVSAAVMALLLAQLEKGVRPVQVVRDVLARGIRVHDSVYNKATQRLMANGDLRGAAAMCEVAAKENGNGELAYNEYNLSNLIFAYTGTVQYTSLEKLLSRLMSQGWAGWHSSKVCRESLKLAIKTTAKRAAVGDDRAHAHLQAHDLLKETLEYVKSRPTTTQRVAVRAEMLRLAGVEVETSELEGEVRSANLKPSEPEVSRPDMEAIIREHRRPLESAAGAA